MSATVLLLGGTGRTGRLALMQLPRRGAQMRAPVRSADRLPEEVREAVGLTIIETDLLLLSEAHLRSLVQGCDAVISCLGHSAMFGGIIGRPRNLTARSVTRVCRAVGTSRRSPVTIIFAFLSAFA